ASHREPRRPPARVECPRAGGARAPDRRRRRTRLLARAVAARLGRVRRPRRQGGEGDGEQASSKARRPAGGRDGRPRRLPDGRMMLVRLPKNTIRLRLTLAYGGLFLASG